jgi:hypothetical protein
MVFLDGHPHSTSDDGEAVKRRRLTYWLQSWAKKQQLTFHDECLRYVHVQVRAYSTFSEVTSY